MENGWKISPCVNMPEYAYLNDTVSESTASVLYDARDAFAKAYAGYWNNLGRLVISDYAKISVLHMPDNPAALSFIPQPLNGNWLVKGDYKYPYGDYYTAEPADYFNMTQADFADLVNMVLEHALEIKEQYFSVLSCTFADGDKLYELHLFYDNTANKSVHVELIPISEYDPGS
jgi:hypothetical protein